MNCKTLLAITMLIAVAAVGNEARTAVRSHAHAHIDRIRTTRTGDPESQRRGAAPTTSMVNSAADVWRTSQIRGGDRKPFAKTAKLCPAANVFICITGKIELGEYLKNSEGGPVYSRMGSYQLHKDDKFKVRRSPTSSLTPALVFLFFFWITRAIFLLL